MAAGLARSEFEMGERRDCSVSEGADPRDSPLSMAVFVACVDAEAARAFGVDPFDMAGRSRRAAAVQARQVAWSILRARGFSFPAIGRRYARDHTTIIAGLRRFEAMLEHSEDFRRKCAATLGALRKCGVELTEEERAVVRVACDEARKEPAR